MNSDASVDDGIRIVFEVRHCLGVWSLYRHKRALHRSRDGGRIADLAGTLAAREALKTGCPVKTIYFDPDADEPVTYIVRPLDDRPGAREDVPR